MSFQRVIDGTVVRMGGVKALQGHVAEAEVDVRRALLSQLGMAGRYHPITLTMVSRLAGVLIQQGRYREAEQLARISVDTYRAIGFAPDAQNFVHALPDVLHHGREIVAVEHLAPSLAESPQQLLEAGEALSLVVLKAALEQVAQRLLQVAEVHEVIGDRMQQVVGVQ